MRAAAKADFAVVGATGVSVAAVYALCVGEGEEKEALSSLGAAATTAKEGEAADG